MNIMISKHYIFKICLRQVLFGIIFEIRTILFFQNYVINVFNFYFC